jgi:hypothetical protein
MATRKALLGLVILPTFLLALSSPALARSGAVTPAADPATCAISSLPTFVDQGEGATASSVADYVKVSCGPAYSGRSVKVTATELFNRCSDKLEWVGRVEWPILKFLGLVGVGKSVNLRLDGAGNTWAVVFGGPGCAPGESLISAHLEAPPFSTVTTGFTVLAPRPTPLGATVLPAEITLGETASSFGAIVQVEYPTVFAEDWVTITAEQLAARCKIPPHLIWFGPNLKLLGFGAESSARVQLDNDGNAFAVVFGAFSCSAGTADIEATLEEAPYTEERTTLTLLAPQPPGP